MIFLKFYTMKGAKSYMKIILMVFPKNFSSGQMMHGCNSGSAQRVFLKFLKEAERYIKIILMVFQKNFSFRANMPFLAQKSRTAVTVDLL